MEVLVAGFFSYFFFQLVNMAGGLNRLNTSAFGANQVVLLATGVISLNGGPKEDKVGRAFVKAESANHSFFGQALEQTEHGCLITSLREVTT